MQLQNKELSVVILAAGQGTRMRSSLAKVLHHIGGRPMLSHVLDKAKKLNPSQILVVYGHAGEQLRSYYSHENIVWVEQAVQKGTGDAVAKAVPLIPLEHRVLVLYGDVPLISVETLQDLVEHTPREGVGIVTAELADPTGLGRIIRDKKGRVQRIIEEKDATQEERAIKETNSGIALFEAAQLRDWLPKLRHDNAQGELYLTDLTKIAVDQNYPVYTCSPRKINEVAGVNDRCQQAQVERDYQRQQADYHMRQGVQIIDPDRFDVRGELYAEGDVLIDVNVIFQGKNILCKGARIGPNCVLINTEVGEGVTILPYSYLENAKISKDATIGPLARLRPGSDIGQEAHIGTFVEIKNTVVGEKTKINHLSYIGDAIIGREVNIGAGCITCNYDGANKHQTVIEDNVHIGSDSQLIAPVHIGRGATLGAGTTLVKDAPAEKLTLTHQLAQRSQNWQRPVKSNDKK